MFVKISLLLKFNCFFFSSSRPVCNVSVPLKGHASAARVCPLTPLILTFEPPAPVVSPLASNAAMSSALWSQEKPAGGFRDDWRFYMVVKECVVEKPPQKTLRIPRGSLGQVCQERNSLGRPLPPSKGKRSLRILDQTNVVVSVDERDVLELDEKLAELLFPITNCEERYGLLCNKPRLDRAREIDCGSKVRVQLRSGDEPLPGVVRFKGALLPDRALSGIWFGVELLVRTEACFV